MRLRALTAEYKTMLAAERNGRRLGLSEVFFKNPVWLARRDYLQSLLIVPGNTDPKAGA